MGRDLHLHDAVDPAFVTQVLDGLADLRFLVFQQARFLADAEDAVGPGDRFGVVDGAFDLHRKPFVRGRAGQRHRGIFAQALPGLRDDDFTIEGFDGGVLAPDFHGLAEASDLHDELLGAVDHLHFVAVVLAHHGVRVPDLESPAVRDIPGLK